MSLNQPQNHTEKSSNKLSIAELQAKKSSILQKMGGLAAGALMLVGTNLPAMGTEMKGVLTPDMHPTSNQLKTQDGSNLTPQINPNSQTQGTETQDGSELSEKFSGDGNGLPMDYDLNSNQSFSLKEISQLNKMTKTPEGRSQITDDLSDVPFFDHPKETTNIGEAWIPEEHPGE
jgi:hypothetical protein